MKITRTRRYGFLNDGTHLRQCNDTNGLRSRLYGYVLLLNHLISSLSGSFYFSTVYFVFSVLFHIDHVGVGIGVDGNIISGYSLHVVLLGNVSCM
jgi:hypothetical protein